VGNHGHLKSVTGKPHSLQGTAVYQTDDFCSINYSIAITLKAFNYMTYTFIITVISNHYLPPSVAGHSACSLKTIFYVTWLVKL
jgi:hypothetical protein